MTIKTDHIDEHALEDRVSQVSGLEHQLAIAQRIMRIGSWEWKLDGAYATWSDELYRICGLEPQCCRMTLESFLSRVHPEDREAVENNVRHAIECGGRFEWRQRIFRPDGSLRDLETVGDVIRDDRGQPTVLIGACRDVTEERRQDETIRVYADIVRHAQIGLMVWDVTGFDHEREPLLTAFNPAAEQQTKLELGSRVGMGLDTIFEPEMTAKLACLLRDVACHRSPRDLVDCRFEGGKFAGVFAVKAFPLPNGRVGLAIEDTTERSRAHSLQQGEQRVLEMIASGATLAAILRELVLLIEQQSLDMLGSILLVDDDAAHLRHGAAPNLPDAYNQLVDGIAIGPAAGSCGTAAYLKRAVFVDDIDTDPLWAPYRDQVRCHGLRACWSTPILSKHGRVLGTFACYYREPHRATEHDIRLIGRATYLAGIAIERRQLEDQLRALSARVESVREDERTGIAREIHDELGQALTAVKMDLAMLVKRSLQHAGLSHAMVVESVESIGRLTDDMLSQVRRISAQLRPGVLDDLGLLAAVEWQAQECQKRTGIQFTIESNVGDASFGRALSTATFRIFQEALTNVVRHSGARHVRVRLDCSDVWLHLDVTDDGCGIAVEVLDSRQSLGLLGIRERARVLGGNVKISPRPEGGTTVALALPIARSERHPGL